MSEFTCPCGFRVGGEFREVWSAYQAHDCPHHPGEGEVAEEPSAAGCGWAVVALTVSLLFLSFICTDGWGRFS